MSSIRFGQICASFYKYMIYLMYMNPDRVVDYWNHVPIAVHYATKCQVYTTAQGAENQTLVSLFLLGKVNFLRPMAA